MLAAAIFPGLQNDASGPAMGSPEEMQRNDPLGTQIWKLYSKARAQLPNAERMENLTWRMMAMSMRRAERDRNKGYGCRHEERSAEPQPCPPPVASANSASATRRQAQSSQMNPPPMPAPPRPALKSAPSGIAQLRRSVDQQAQVQLPQPAADAMNLDDFIQPSSVGSPAGLPPSPSNETPTLSNATAPAIPIRTANQYHDQNLGLAHASAPPVPPAIHRDRENEFAYVQRHVRKTSIDERRVSLHPLVPCPPHPANPLSASQAASRGLSTGASCQQHHDPQQPR